MEVKARGVPASERLLMSLFSGPVEHEANAPETWVVVHSGPGAWALRDKSGNTIQVFKTKMAAEAGKTEGFFATLYAKETRWYAGEQVDGWKPFVPKANS